MMNRFVSWLSNVTREFVAKCHRARRRRPSPRSRSVRPYVLALEDRTVPAVIGWDGGGDGILFDDALNWDLDVVPGPNDDAFIPYTGGSVGGTSASLRSLTSDAPLSFLGSLSLQVSGAFASDLTVNGTFTLAAGGDLTFQNGMAALAAASFGDGATGDFSSGWLGGTSPWGTRPPCSSGTISTSAAWTSPGRPG